MASRQLLGTVSYYDTERFTVQYDSVNFTVQYAYVIVRLLYISSNKYVSLLYICYTCNGGANSDARTSQVFDT